MGREAECRARFGDFSGTGKVLLETDDVIFRGPERLRIPLASIRGAEVDGAWLVLAHANGQARFELGDAPAKKWAHAILNPRTRADKLGVKEGSKVLVLGLAGDDAFMDELRARTAHVDTGGRAQGYDVLFLRVDDANDLARLTKLKDRIAPAGGIWVIHPKGRHDLSHDVLVGAARNAGLVDNKTARFSDTHTGLRFVIPRSKR